MKNHTITQAEKRLDVVITFESGAILKGDIGTTAEEFTQFAVNNGLITVDAPIIAAVCNNKLRELNYAIHHDVTLKPVTLASSDGGRIYRRSLIFLMVTALNELYNGVQVSVGYAVPDGGYFCELVNYPPLTPEDLERLEQTMQQIVAENAPIRKQVVSLEEAQALFAQRGDDDKVRLLQYRHRDELVLYQLRQHIDYYFGYMVPSSGYLTTFKLIWVEGGFILQYPRQENPSELGKLDAFSKLSQVFQQANHWLQRLKIQDIGSLNALISTDRVQEMILVSEALHEKQISTIASQIAQGFERGVRIVAIAGPSSSGKTSCAKRLAIQLLAQGLSPLTIEMDNFFIDRELTPRDENGDFDFESLYALNLNAFNDTIGRLLQGEAVYLPKFDFYTGKSYPDTEVQLTNKQVIILEGIHGLNPNLFFDAIPKHQIFRIYVSALTQLNVDRHNRVSTTDVRLLRRIIRDARTRGYSATQTLNRWSSVRRGEKRNIFPHQENADAMFNSALVYELAALKQSVEPLLLQVEPNTPAGIETNRLLAFLRWVQPLTTEQINLIPDTSILREFIGGAVLDYYHPGAQRHS